MAREREDLESDPLTAYLVEWFTDLNDGRRFTVIVGMGGGASIPEAISYQEMQAWAELTGNRPAPWEVAALKAMDRSWRTAYSAKQSKKGSSPQEGAQHQALGEYCQGAEVKECRKVFGAQLEKICATCPN